MSSAKREYNFTFVAGSGRFEKEDKGMGLLRDSEIVW